MKIWAKRQTVARGSEWVLERSCAEAEVQAWLSIFREDEPTVLFVAGTRKPKAR